ncbi:MAG: hypothetical protein EOP82_30845 [Variovorax sp.]|nr:MAG: hypothetical protein EOP82_30845 [Variovorax sp.]
MSILQRPYGTNAADPRARALRVLAAEAGALVKALLSPNKIIKEVEQMRALHDAANRVESSDKARAALLRSRASRIGLR